MASLMEELIDCLETEEKEFERLLALSQQKTPIIVSNKIAELEKITDEEQVIVSRISNLETKRETVTKDIAEVINKDVAELKLTTLIDLMSNQPGERDQPGHCAAGTRSGTAFRRPSAPDAGRGRAGLSTGGGDRPRQKSLGPEAPGGVDPPDGGRDAAEHPPEQVPRRPPQGFPGALCQDPRLSGLGGADPREPDRGPLPG